MRRRALITIAALLTVTSCATYFIVQASVRSGANRTIQQAAQFTASGKSDRARQELKWLLWFEPTHPRALHLMGMSYLKDNNLPEARKYLRQIGRDSSIHENAQSLIASALLADEFYDEADALLRQHLEQYPGSAIACRQLSGILLTELRPREAVQVIEEFLQRSLSKPVPLSDLLLLLRDLGSAEFHAPIPQDCLATLTKVVGRHPDQPAVQLALANCYLRLGQADEADQALEAAHRLNVAGWDVRRVACELWLLKGDADRAEVALTGSNSPEPSIDGQAEMESDDRSWDLRSRIAELRGDNERALADLEKALKLRPFTKEYESQRARYLQKLNRAEEARRSYERSHEFAKSELELWRLTRDLGVRTPTVTECESVASLYESLGRTRPADAWRLLSKMLAETPATKRTR